MADTPVFPNPIFEGSEKRIEIDFYNKEGPVGDGLRGFTRAHLDELMTLARCEIVSSRNNKFFDAYVLSESSLFVYPSKWILKTCGTTKLLNSVPRLVELAKDQGLNAYRVKYSRASYLNPTQQEFPHTAFDHEVEFLEQHFGHLGHGGKDHVLGDEKCGLQWHVYIAADPDVEVEHTRKSTYNMEICMTSLCRNAASQFYRTEKFINARHTTMETGIHAIKPNAIIDDYVFEPCGYSMNGIEDTGLMTIHITPEAGFSYASLEMSGYEEDLADPHKLLAQAIDIFNPGNISFALTCDHYDNSPADALWGTVKLCPDGYNMTGESVKELEYGGRVHYYTMTGGQPVRAKEAPGSPVTVLASAVSSGCTDSDADAYEIEETS